MGREIFRYNEIDADDFVRVNQNTITLEFFHTATYTTNSGAAGATSVAVAEGGGFSNGDSIYVGTNDVDIQSGAGGASGIGADTFTTTATAASFSANEAVVLHTSGGSSQRATWYSDPDFATGSSAAITLDSNNEAEVFLKPGQYGIRFSQSGTTLRTDYAEVIEELDWVQVTPGHTSTTAGILEAINKLGSGGGTVYIGPGTYNITSRILISGDNIRLMGAGKDRTILFQPNSTNLADNGLIDYTGDNGEVSDLTIDMNNDNNTTSTMKGITFTSVTDLYIHDCIIKNCRNHGIANSATGNASTRVMIKDNYLTNIGNRGIAIFYGVDCQITGNIIEQTNHHGIEVLNGTSQDMDYSRKILISDNIVDRSVACTEGNVSYDGFLCAIGGGSEDVIVCNNVFNDNSLSGGLDGIGWGFNTGSSKAWERIVIDGNVVSNTGTFGIDAMTNCVISNNIVYKAGTHGIRFAGTDAELGFQGVVIDGNVVVDANEDAIDVGTDRIHGISIYLNENSQQVNNAVISNNIVRDTRGTKQCHYGLGIVKNNSATSTAVNNITITGNDFKNVLTASVDWLGDTGLTAPTNAVDAITGLIWRNNLTTDAYRGEATLGTTGSAVAGTADIQNTNWPALSDLKFVISRTDDNGGGSGALEGKYDQTNTLNISSYGQTFTTFDPGLDKTGLEVEDATVAVNKHDGDGTVSQQEAPGAFTVARMIFRTTDVDGGTSMDIHLEDSEGTPNVLTEAQTLLSASGDNTWYSIAGSGTAAVSGSALNLRSSNEVGSVTDIGVEQIYIIWNIADVNGGDTSKVYWEMVGQV